MNDLHNTPKVQAAKRLAESLQTHDDFIMYLMDHPNAENAAKRIWRDMTANPSNDNAEQHDS